MSAGKKGAEYLRKVSKRLIEGSDPAKTVKAKLTGEDAGMLKAIRDADRKRVPVKKEDVNLLQRIKEADDRKHTPKITAKKGDVAVNKEDLNMLDRILKGNQKEAPKTAYPKLKAKEDDVAFRKDDLDMLGRIGAGKQKQAPKPPKMRVKSADSGAVSGGPGAASPRAYRGAVSPEESQRLGKKFVLSDTGKKIGGGTVVAGTTMAMTGDEGPPKEEMGPPREQAGPPPPTEEDQKPVVTEEKQETKPKQEPAPVKEVEKTKFKPVRAELEKIADPEYKTYDSHKDMAVAMLAMNKQIDAAMRTYKEERDLLRRRRLWEGIANGLIMIAVGASGIKRGLDMSSTKLHETDWYQEMNSLRQDLEQETGAAKSKFATAKESAAMKQADTDRYNRAQQAVFDNAMKRNDFRAKVDNYNNDMMLKAAGVDIQREKLLLNWEELGAKKQKNIMDALAKRSKTGVLDKANLQRFKDINKFLSETSNEELYGSRASNFRKAAIAIAEFKDATGIELLSPAEIKKYEDDPAGAQQLVMERVQRGALSSTGDKPTPTRTITKARFDQLVKDRQKAQPNYTELEARQLLRSKGVQIIE